MKKKLLSIFTILFILAFAIGMVACQDYVEDDNKSDEESKPTYTHTIKNGTFYDSKTTATKESGNMAILDSVDGWSVGSGSTTNSATPASGVFSAAVDVSAESFNDIVKNYFVINKDLDGNQLETPIKFSQTPGLAPHIPQVDKLDKNGEAVRDENNNVVKENEDSNVLALVSKDSEGSIYMSTSSKATLKKNKVYLFQFSVCTLIDAEDGDTDKGAWVSLSGDFNYTVKSINTKGEWKTYYYFIETNKSSDYSLGVQLWLGYGPGVKETDDKGKYSTRGVALFDNILCEEVDPSALKTAIAETDKNSYEINYGAYVYDKEANTHDDFVSFKANLSSKKDSAGNSYAKAISVYFLKNQTMELRTALSNFSSDSNRPYFYSFREKYSESNLVGWAKASSETSLNSRYYGSVNLAELYKETTETDESKITDTYKNLLTSTYQSNLYFMGYNAWKNGVMNDSDHKINGSDDTFAMMLYNTGLQANNIYSSEKLAIEANMYYEISVWAYVWAHDYDKTTGIKYIPEYSGMTEPYDPRDYANTSNSTRFSEVNARIYSLYEKDISTEYAWAAKYSNMDGYFTELNEEQTTAADNFNEADMGEFKFTGAQSGTYKALAKEWLAGLFGIEKDDVPDDLIQVFYYTYLEMNFDNLSADEKNTLNAYRTTITNGYYNERKSHITTVTKDGGLKSKVDSYLESKQEYDEKKGTYDAAYTSWLGGETAENKKPVATLILSGVGDDITESTTSEDFMKWTKITIRVRGNQLSSRNLTVKMALGTGTDYNTYMPGGVFFDNLEIKSYETNPDESVEWKAFSQIKTENEISYGGLFGNEELADVKKAEIEADWKVETVDGTAESDANEVEVKADSYGEPITVNEEDKYLYAVNYTNKIPTASKLTYLGTPIKIVKNKFYRFALSIKTSGMEEGKGVSLKLVYGSNPETTDSDVSSGSVSGYYTDDAWKEVVFYLRGDLLEDYYVNLIATMGSGTRFSTDSYVAGTLSIAAFNCLEIDYDEYSDADTGDKIVKGLSLYNISYETGDGSDNITNSYYAQLNYSDTKETAFDEDGKLIGIGATSGWTTSTTQNKFNTPESVTLDTVNKKLSWKKSTGYSSDENGNIKKTEAIAYEIWMKYTFDNKEEVKLYDIITVTDTEQETYEYVIAGSDDWTSTVFAVKAIGTEGVSSLSSYTTAKLGKANGNKPVQKKNDADACEAEAGTILSDGLFLDKVDGINYVSPYPTVLKMKTDYKSVLSITSGSKTLEANSYYKVSVWARTTMGTNASISITGTSGSLQATTNSGELGFVQITTNDKWFEYCFYIKTGNFKPSMKIRYSLGNPYAKSKSQKLTGDISTTVYYNAEDFCKEGGEAYFDAVRIVTVDENEYNEAVDIDKNKGSDKYGKDSHSVLYTDLPYYVYVMEYAVDSFDAASAPSSGSEKELGNVPGNYNHAIGSQISSQNNTDSVYGVYDVNSDDENMMKAVKYLYTYTKSDEDEITYAFNEIVEKFPGLKAKYSSDESNWGEEEWNNFIKDFLVIDNEDGYKGGSNVLVMSNKAKGGYAQNYALGSNYSYTAGKGTYNKITFTARTLIADVTSKDVQEGGSTVKKYDYNIDNAYAQLCVSPTGKDSDIINVKVNSYKYGAKANVFDAVTYTVYLYNPTDSDSTATWTFYLGKDEDDENPDNELAGYLIGLMAIDLVSAEEIEESEYNAGIASISTDGSTVYKYEYTEEETDPDPDTNPDTDNKEEEEKESFWDKLFNNEYFWLYISSFVIAVVIIITVIAVLINRWKKKHPKEVIVENAVKTEKDIKIVPTATQEKEDVLESDDYVDKITPAPYRPTDHKKKKKRK